MPLDTMLRSRQTHILSAQNRSPWKNADRGQTLLAAATPRLLVAGQMLVVVGVACRGEAAVVKEVPFPRTQAAALFNSAAARVAVAMSPPRDEVRHKLFEASNLEAFLPASMRLNLPHHFEGICPVLDLQWRILIRPSTDGHCNVYYASAYSRVWKSLSVCRFILLCISAWQAWGI
jgi:hypothetical protein